MPKSLASAERQEDFYAQDAGVDIETDGVTWQPIVIPAYKQCKYMVLQVQKAVPTFDFYADLTSFRVSANITGPGIQSGSAGIALPYSHDPRKIDESVRYVLAPTGYKILVSLIY